MPDDEVPLQPGLFDESGEAFEGLAKANGTRYWFARDFMAILGYDSWASFKVAINKAVGVCTTTGIPVLEHFIQVKRQINSREVEDFRMTRLACCLTAMNGDTKNPLIAKAQAYFAALDQVVQDIVVIQAESMDRLIARGEISAREVTLCKTASEAGVQYQDRFHNAGYRGMYNMDLIDLKKLKGVPDLKRPLFDFMGRDELAGNLFRLSLTEGRIKKEQIRGQLALEHVAKDVGARVRRTMIEEAGTAPENLPIAPDIKSVKKALKRTTKAFAEVDNLEQQRAIEAATMALMPCPPNDGVYPDCPECQAGNEYSHLGSPHCTSGSIASGGLLAHCECDYCSAL
jgi:DNA-damage-inducible protein D